VPSPGEIAVVEGEEAGGFAAGGDDADGALSSLSVQTVCAFAGGRR
jgi:hypothetical protein